MYIIINIVTDSFGMTKIHKDIAMRLMECANSIEYSDQAIVKVIIIIIITTHSNVYCNV